MIPLKNLISAILFCFLLSQSPFIYAQMEGDSFSSSFHEFLRSDIIHRQYQDQVRWTATRDNSKEAFEWLDKLQLEVFLVMLDNAPEFREEAYEKISSELKVSQEVIKDMELYLGMMLFEDLSFVGEDKLEVQEYLESICREYRLLNPRANSAESRYFYYLSNIGAYSIPQIAEKLSIHEHQVRAEFSQLRLSIEEELVSERIWEFYQHYRNQSVLSHEQAIAAVQHTLGYPDDQGIRFYLSYEGERNRGRVWGTAEIEYLKKLHAQGRSYAEMVALLNQRFGHKVDDLDYRTEGSVAYKLRDLNLVNSRMQTKTLPIVIPGYGEVLDKNNQLQIENTKSFLHDHWNWLLSDLADALGVDPQTVYRFAKRHDIPLVSTEGSTGSKNQWQSQRLKLSEKEKKDAKAKYAAQRDSRKKYRHLNLDDIIKEMDQYVVDHCGGDRSKLSTKNKPGAKVKIETILKNFGLAFAKKRGDFKEGWNTQNILSQEGYSLKELVNEYRIMKGDVIEKEYSEYTLDELVKVIDQYVVDHCEGDRGSLTTTKKLDAKVKIQTILKNFGLALAKKRGDFQEGWNTLNIPSKEGYSFKELVNEYRIMKGDVIEERIFYSKLDFRDLVKVMDDLVQKEFINDPKALPLAKKNELQIDFESLWRNYGIKLSKEREDFKEGWTTKNINLQPGYSFPELKDHYIAHRDKCRATFDFSGKIQNTSTLTNGS